jgi:hypothetical protein
MKLDMHPDWYADGVEMGEYLWRMDLPDVQIQLFVNVLSDIGPNGEALYGDDFRLFIEHDVRDPKGEKRVKYSGDHFDRPSEFHRRLLASSRELVATLLASEIEKVKAMPNDPAMCR